MYWCGKLLLDRQQTCKRRIGEFLDFILTLLLLLSGGLAPGDIITHINGKSVSSSGNIYEALGEKGTALIMTVVRGNSRLQLRVTPEDYDS